MRPFFVAIESLFNPALAAEVWPARITSNPIFVEQVKQRQELIERLEDVVGCLPQADMPLEIAISQNYVTEEQMAELYESLSGLLEFGWDYMRLVLYLPFEFLPNKTWHPSGIILQQASLRFKQAYLRTWKRLLSVQDVRANFVDGDVLELDRRIEELPRVVKAAHLIPKLVERGLLEVQDVRAIMRECNDPVLKDSIAEAFSVLADLGLISSNDSIVSPPKASKLSCIRGTLKEELSWIGEEELGDVTPKRADWLRQKKSEETIEVFAKDVCAAILANRFDDKMMASVLGSSAASRQMLIEGISRAIESVAQANPQMAQTLYQRYKKTLIGLWVDADPEVKEALTKAFRYFRQLRIVGRGQLAELDIAIPNLAGSFSENLKLMEKEIDDIQNMITAAGRDSELSQFIYPAITVFGSRLNGYGKESADIDLGVFVQPGTPFEKKARLKELLQEAFSHEKIRSDEIIEFWLKRKGNNLSVCDFDESDTSLGESHWMHILFGAAWLGREETIRELFEKLLTPYMQSNTRRACLEDMEQGTLQYRLMHKGYKRFFPPQGGIRTPHSDQIDGQSMFWDSGYRQLATRLFASRVFLPKI